MSKVWAFLGGVVVGAVGIVTAALVSDRLDSGGSGKGEKNEREEPLALPEGNVGKQG